MIIVFSNRKVNPTETNENVFGNEVNPLGIDRLRMAIATYDTSSKEWSLKLQADVDPLSADSLPCKQLFAEVVRRIDPKRKLSKKERLAKEWVYFVHGHNKNMRDLLNECHEYEKNFHVNVLAFAWPSNPGGSILEEFKQSKENAIQSERALSQSLKILKELIAEIPGDTVVLTLMAHSLGNLVLKQWVESGNHRESSGLFKNIIFHQAAVEAKDHAKWIDLLEGSRIYITLNKQRQCIDRSGFTRGLGGNAARSSRSRFKCDEAHLYQFHWGT